MRDRQIDPPLRELVFKTGKGRKKKLTFLRRKIECAMYEAELETLNRGGHRHRRGLATHEQIAHEQRVDDLLENILHPRTDRHHHLTELTRLSQQLPGGYK